MKRTQSAKKQKSALAASIWLNKNTFIAVLVSIFAAQEEYLFKKSTR